MITIDQSKIDAPGFPRTQEWWTRFLPMWVTGTVQDDGTVTIEPSGMEARYTAERGLFYQPPASKQRAAYLRRCHERGVLRWLYRWPRLEPAIVEDVSGRCNCWKYPVRLHEGHCCFTDARVCHSMPEDMREQPGRPIPA